MPECRSDAPIEEEAEGVHKVPLVRHDFPLHNWSFNAAVMARHFDSLGKELGNQFRDYIFRHQPEIIPDNLQGFAQKFAAEHFAMRVSCLHRTFDLLRFNDEGREGATQGMTMAERVRSRSARHRESTPPPFSFPALHGRDDSYNLP